MRNLNEGKANWLTSRMTKKAGFGISHKYSQFVNCKATFRTYSKRVSGKFRCLSMIEISWSNDDHVKRLTKRRLQSVKGSSGLITNVRMAEVTNFVILNFVKAHSATS